MSKSEKDMRALREQQENEVLRRVLFWLGAAVLLETVVLLTNRFFFHALTTPAEMQLQQVLFQVLEILRFAGFIVAAGFLIWALAGRKKDAHCGIARIISAAFFAALSVCAILFVHIGMSSVSVLLVGIPAVAGLIMIYYLYQREFFVLAALCGLGILGLWVYRQGSVRYLNLYYVYAVLVVLLAIAIAFLCRRLQAAEGSFSLGERKLEIFKADVNYLPLWISTALVAVSLVLAPLVGTAFAYYAFLGLIIWIFVMAVYYTSKLM